MLCTPTKHSNIILPHRGVVAITGATGWVGRTAIEELQRLIPQSLFSSRVRLFGSENSTLSLNSGNVHVYKLSKLAELASNEQLVAVLHAAFLTRDHLMSIGHDAYVETNRWITKQVAQALQLSPNARAAVISSGAATTDNLDLGSNPYAVLKREEELALSSIVPSIVLRIYALSGRFIRKPHRFALGDFLMMAKRKEPIRIRAAIPVIRSYAHATNITALAWQWLFSGDLTLCSKPLLTATHNIDLLSLAQRIASLYDLPPVQACIDPHAVPDRYITDPEPFIATLNSFGLSPSTLDHQLKDTAAGIEIGSGGMIEGLER